MCSGLLVIGLGKLPNQLLKDISHVGRGDLLGRHICFCRVELLNHHKEDAAFNHRADGIGKLKAGNNISYICREALEVIIEVVSDIIRIGKQLLEVKLAGVVEGIAGSAGQSAFDKLLICSGRIQLLFHFENSLFGGRKGIVKAFENGHGQNNLPVLMGLKQTHKMRGTLPNQIGLLLDIRIGLLLKLIELHISHPPSG